MVIGDKLKYLTVLLTLKLVPGKDGKFTRDITPECQADLRDIGVSAKTIDEALKCEVLRKIINDGIAKANEKAISKAQRI